MADINLGQSGAFGSMLAVFADLVFNSGEFLAFIASWLMSNADLLLPLFTTLRSQIAPKVAWLPAGTIDRVVFALAVLFVLITFSKLVRRTIEARR